jgi:hypothetical protein
VRARHRHHHRRRRITASHGLTSVHTAAFDARCCSQFVPAVAARDECPFDGIWFCGGFASIDQCVKALDKASAKATAKAGASVSGSASAADETAKTSGAVRVCTSLAALRDAALLPSTSEVVSELSEVEREARKRRLAALDATRHADPQRAQRKRQKQYEQRAERAEQGDETAFGRELTEEMRTCVLATPRACKHFFGITSGSRCTRGAGCRFLHQVDGVN